MSDDKLRYQLKVYLKNKIENEGLTGISGANFVDQISPKSGKVIPKNIEYTEWVDRMPIEFVKDYLGYFYAMDEGRYVNDSEVDEVIENWLKCGEGPGNGPSNRARCKHFTPIDWEMISGLVSTAIRNERVKQIDKCKKAIADMEEEIYAHVTITNEDDFADQIEKYRKALTLISLYPNFVSPGDEESTIQKIAREALNED